MNWRDMLQRPGDRILYVLAAIVVRGLLGAIASVTVFSLIVRYSRFMDEDELWTLIIVSGVLGFLIGVASVRKGPGAI